MAPTVRDNPDRFRFEILIDGSVVGFSEYRIVQDRVVFTHTETEDGHEGEGLASLLVKSALDDVRARGRKIVPLCPFVASYIERHGEYADLIDQALASELDH